jgi:hypothetical protein
LVDSWLQVSFFGIKKWVSVGNSPGTQKTKVKTTKIISFPWKTQIVKGPHKIEI